MKLQDSASKIVPEQVVEAACLEIGGLSEDQARPHMQRLSRRQPALLAFVTAFSEDLTKDGAELGIYMFVAIVHMFEMHFGKRLQNVGPKRIESTHEENVKMLDRLWNGFQTLPPGYPPWTSFWPKIPNHSALGSAQTGRSAPRFRAGFRDSLKTWRATGIRPCLRCSARSCLRSCTAARSFTS